MLAGGAVPLRPFGLSGFFRAKSNGAADSALEAKGELTLFITAGALDNV